MGSEATRLLLREGSDSVADLCPPPPPPDSLFCSLPRTASFPPCLGTLGQRHEKLRLEISREGFRLLRQSSADALFAYPFPRVHSWAHAGTNFSFRYIREGCKSVETFQFQGSQEDVKKMIQNLKDIVEELVKERTQIQIPEELMKPLIKEVAQAARHGGGVDVIQRQAETYMFSALQGRILIEQIPGVFERMEAACLLHSRLVDQHKFRYLLEVLENEEDRKNVWYRLDSVKRHTSSKKLLNARAAGAARPAG